jgi:hypothetical protein
MKRVITRTKTVDNFSDGKTSTSETERIEETPYSGLLEAWGALVLFLFTVLLFLFTYRIVSSITQGDQQHGIQERQYQEVETDYGAKRDEQQ